MADNNRILDIAMQIRSARVVDEYMGSMRLALDETLRTNVDSVRAVRDDMVVMQTNASEAQDKILESQAKILESQQTLIDSVVELIAAIGERMKDPVQVNVPETIVNVEVAPATVTIPKPPAQIKPVITVNVPEPKTEKTASKLPKRITINHSDGTSSTIDLK